MQRERSRASRRLEHSPRLVGTEVICGAGRPRILDCSCGRTHGADGDDLTVLIDGPQVPGGDERAKYKKQWEQQSRPPDKRLSGPAGEWRAEQLSSRQFDVKPDLSQDRYELVLSKVVGHMMSCAVPTAEIGR